MIYHDNKKGIYEVEGKFIDIIGEIGSLLVFFLKNSDISQEVGEKVIKDVYETVLETYRECYGEDEESTRQPSAMC